MALLEDETVVYVVVQEVLLARNVLSHAAAAKVFYTLDRNQLLDIPMFHKLGRWFTNMGDRMETEEQRKDKYLLCLLKSQLVPDLKTFND